MNVTNIVELSDLCTDPKNVLDFLQSRNVISKTVFCQNCNRELSLTKRVSCKACYEWRCGGCARKQSVLKHSFISALHLSPANFLYLCFYWATQIPQHCVYEHLDISPKAICDFFQMFREVCSWKISQEPVQLGGMGRVVQIDESVMVKAKDNTTEKWVFGAYDVEAKLGFITFVEKRDEETLLPIIERIILPYTTIVSDEWAVYQNISSSKNCYVHETVNSTGNFVDPETGAHTNNVKNYWGRVKSMFKRINGAKSEIEPSNLDEFMWRERYSKGKGEAFNNLLLHISQMHPC